MGGQRLPPGLHHHHPAGRPRRGHLGRPPALSGGARGVHGRLAARGARPVARRADRGAARPGRRRRDPRAGRDGRGVPPLRRLQSGEGPRLHRGPDVPGHGGRAVRGRLDPRLGPPRGRPGPGRAGLGRAGREPVAVVALGLLHQRPDRPRRARPRLGRQLGLGDATARGRPRPAWRRALQPRPGRAPRRPDAPRRELRPAGPRPDVSAGGAAPRGGRVRDARRRERAARARPLPRPSSLSDARVQLRRPRLADHRLRPGHRDRGRRGLRGPGPLRRPRPAADRPRGARRRNCDRRPRLRIRRAPALPARRHPGRSAAERRCPVADVRAGALRRRSTRWVWAWPPSAWASA